MNNRNKKIIGVILIILLSLAVPGWTATSYYVDSASTGGDGTTADLTGAHAAFKTQLAAHTALTGDQSDNFLLTKRGTVYHESVTVNGSGTSGHLFTLDAYGVGAAPVIDGFDVLTDWSSYGRTYGGVVYAGANSTGSFNFRCAIPANTLLYSDAQVRITVKGGTSATTITSAFIGQKAAAGDLYDMEPGTITQITFDGNNSYVMGLSEYKKSDWITYSFDKTKDYIVSIGSTGGFVITAVDGHNNYFKSNAQADAGTADVTGYTSNTNRYLLHKLEITPSTVWYKALVVAPWLVTFNYDIIGTQQAGIGSLTAPYNWYWTPNTLYVYSASDPNTAYTAPGIRSNSVREGFKTNGKSYVTIKNIDIYGSVTHGLEVTGGSNITADTVTVKQCKLDGMEWLNSAAGVVTNCDVSYGGRDGISSNGTGGLSCWYSHSHHNGLLTTGNPGDGYTSHDSSIFNAYYCYGYNNTKSGIAVTGSGGGSIIGCDFYNNFDATDSLGAGWLSNLGIGIQSTGTYIVKNNITSGHQYEYFIDTGSFPGLTLISDNNCFYDSRKGDYAGKCFHYNNTDYSWADFKTQSGTDANSINTDPRWVDPTIYNFDLLPDSPCVGKGSRGDRGGPPIGARPNPPGVGDR